MRIRLSIAVLALIGSTAVVAADLLPLKQGLYVPVTRLCKGASNAEIVNYWGGKSSIGASQAECTIKKISRKGTVYTLVDVCKDIQSGDEIEGDATVLNIADTTHFRMNGTSYRYCGVQRQF